MDTQAAQAKDDAVSDNPSAVSNPNKEVEPQRAQEAAIVGEIRELDKKASKEKADTYITELDKAAVEKEKARIPADVKKAGVVDIAESASETLKHHSTLTLPIDEKTYREGEKEKVRGKVSNTVVFGVSSLAGLVIWIDKKMKISNAVKVIFKKKQVHTEGGHDADRIGKHPA